MPVWVNSTEVLRSGNTFGEGSLRKFSNPTMPHTLVFWGGGWGLLHYGTFTEGTLGPNRSRIGQRIRHCLHLTEQLVVLHPLLRRQLT